MESSSPNALDLALNHCRSTLKQAIQDYLLSSSLSEEWDESTIVSKKKKKNMNQPSHHHHDLDGHSFSPPLFTSREFPNIHQAFDLFMKDYEREIIQPFRNLEQAFEKCLAFFYEQLWSKRMENNDSVVSGVTDRILSIVIQRR